MYKVSLLRSVRRRPKSVRNRSALSRSGRPKARYASALARVVGLGWRAGCWVVSCMVMRSGRACGGGSGVDVRRRGAKQVEALAHQPIRIGDRTVVKNRPVGPQDCDPTHGGDARQKHVVEVFPATLRRDVQALPLMGDLHHFSASSSESRQHGRVELWLRIAAKADQGEPGAKDVVAQADDPIGTANAALRDHRTAGQLRTRTALDEQPRRK